MVGFLFLPWGGVMAWVPSLVPAVVAGT
jgi:hypothetical protein